MSLLRVFPLEVKSTWVQTYCVILDMSLGHSVPWFPYVKMGMIIQLTSWVYTLSTQKSVPGKQQGYASFSISVI